MTRAELQKQRYRKHMQKQFEDPRFRKAYEEDLAGFNLAVEIAKLREQVGLSQTAVAARLNTSQSVISRLENGENVELKTLMRVLSILDATIRIERIQRPSEKTLPLLQSHPATS